MLVQHAFQGHPESPRLWAKMIDNIIRSEVNLQPITHEPCLYSRYVDGYKVLFLRQVDDFAFFKRRKGKIVIRKKVAELGVAYLNGQDGSYFLFICYPLRYHPSWSKDGFFCRNVQTLTVMGKRPNIKIPKSNYFEHPFFVAVKDQCCK